MYTGKIAHQVRYTILCYIKDVHRELRDDGTLHIFIIDYRSPLFFLRYCSHAQLYSPMVDEQRMGDTNQK